MGIYIKGMEMPKNCFECIFAYDEWCYAIKPTDPNAKYLAAKTKPLIAINPRPTWCPLIEVPPHGDLIDRDALMSGVDDGDDFMFVWAITDAPTIIESEGEDG